MQNNVSALVAGATGLVGAELVGLLGQSGQYKEVAILVRKTQNLGIKKVREIVTDFDNLDKLGLGLKVDDAFCCLGTTMKKAGSKEAFYKVDHTYVHRFAQLALDNGAKRFFLVSALGANSRSMVYYNKVKGEIEEVVKGMGFEAVHIFQPSLLLGIRKEKRIGEDFGKLFNYLFAPIIPKKYKGIQASTVARAMLAKAGETNSGVFTYPSDKIRDIVAGS